LEEKAPCKSLLGAFSLHKNYHHSVMETPTDHKSGFVNIIGNPNVGKSTLMNALVGEKLAIITNKPQTTRQRIIGIVNDAHYQIVFSDTPGFVHQPAYKMHELMNRFIHTSLEDADVLLFVTDVKEIYPDDHPLLEALHKTQVPIIFVLNKVDLSTQDEIKTKLALWKKRINYTEGIPTAALHGYNVDKVFDTILKYLPQAPPYYPKDQLSDKPERFFVAEIIREKIFEQYRQEIPYATEVVVESFKEGTTTQGIPIVRIMAYIFVERNSQKNIIIGHKGEAIKRVGMEARRALEAWLDRKVHLELRVKVREKWRNNENLLKKLGYQ